MTTSPSPSVRARCWRASRRCCAGRSSSAAAGPLSAGRVTLDAEDSTVQIGSGEPIALTKLEFRLMQALLAQAGRAVNSDRLLVLVWGHRGAGDRQLLKQLVHRLRQQDRSRTPACRSCCRRPPCPVTNWSSSSRAASFAPGHAGALASGDTGGAMISRRHFHRISMAAATAAVLPGRATAQATPPATAGASRRPDARGTLRPELYGTHGIVAAGRQFTVEAGIRLLRAGGNAFDAGAAAVFAAAVERDLALRPGW